MARINVWKTGASALLLTAAVPVLAQGAPAGTAEKKPDPNEVICEKVKEMGSRLSIKKVCMTRAQWAERRLTDRQDLETRQVQRGYGRGN